jgi:hypothetical protein
VTRERLLEWLTAVVLASLGGALLAVPLTFALRGWLGAGDDGTWSVVIGVGSAAWAITSAAASAVWLRRRSSR